MINIALNNGIFVMANTETDEKINLNSVKNYYGNLSNRSMDSYMENSPPIYQKFFDIIQELFNKQIFTVPLPYMLIILGRLIDDLMTRKSPVKVLVMGNNIELFTKKIEDIYLYFNCFNKIYSVDTSEGNAEEFKIDRRFVGNICDYLDIISDSIFSIVILDGNEFLRLRLDINQVIQKIKRTGILIVYYPEKDIGEVPNLLYDEKISFMGGNVYFTKVNMNYQDDRIKQFLEKYNLINFELVNIRKEEILEIIKQIIELEDYFIKIEDLIHNRELKYLLIKTRTDLLDVYINYQNEYFLTRFNESSCQLKKAIRVEFDI